MGAAQIESRELSLNDGPDILEMIREIGPDANGFMNRGYDMTDGEFPAYLQRHVEMSKGIGLEPGKVPMTTYWLYADGRPAGIGRLRHYLSTALRESGGHIGYCIRPTMRGKGYGNIILEELLEKAREKNIPRALLTCNETNAASRRVIENNRGILEKAEDGHRLYWIGLAESTGVGEIHIDDYDEIYALWGRTPGMGLSGADSQGNILRFLERNKGLSFCRREKGPILGTILCGHDGRRGYIYHVTVAEEARGRGIGSELVEKSLLRLKEKGIDKCHLFVFKDNETGNAFWRSTGWEKRDDIFVYSKSI